MKKRVIRNFFVVILVLIEITSIFLMYKSIKNKPTILDSVNLKEEIKNNNFALMVEKDGEYVSSDTFPTSGYILNEELSGCIDNNGNTLENALTYTSGTIKLKTRTNAMCYLYFDEEKIYASQYLIENVSSDMLWDSTLEEDGYRYVGTNPDNYICFGTTDITECTSNTDLYMYRIIGIFEDESGEQHLKLIKKEALNKSYAWHSDTSTDTNWVNSDLYKGINGSYFLDNATYSYMQESNWLNKIVTWNYTATNTKTYENDGLNYYYNTVKTVYLHELNRDSKTSSVGEWETVSTKISLMYASDYLLSLGSSALNYTSSSNGSTLKTGWMCLNNDGSEDSVIWEWTSSYFGAAQFGGYNAWSVVLDGNVYEWYFESSALARPVFYLTDDTKIDSGTGSSSNPYTITN